MEKVSLRLLEPRDLELLLAWAYIPEIWEYTPTSRKGENLTWEKHLSWWKNRANRLDWVIQVKDEGRIRSVGVAHLIGSYTAPPEVGLYIGEVNLWGQGVGKRALLQVIEVTDSWSHKKLQAVIHPDNIRSVKLFTGCGFRKIGENARGGQDLYELDLGTLSRSKSTVPVYQGSSRLSHSPCPG